MAAKSPARPASPREALAALTSLRTYHDIAIVPQEDIDSAARDLQLAAQIRAASLLSEDDAVRERAQAVYDAARAARDECFYRLWFRGLPSDEFDALVDLHPPTEEERKDDISWNRETFIPALLEACVVDNDLSAEEWAKELEGKPAAEKRAIISNAIAAQRQTMANAVPKD